MGYAIVVDVSVARAAGTSGKPEPQACRQALLAIRNFDHKVSMSKSVENEWMKKEPDKNGNLRAYASLFAISWLVEMRSHNRIEPIVLEENSELRQQCLNELQNNPRTSSSSGPVAKDFHLVETALKSDKRVLSIDKNMFNHLHHLQDIANNVCSVMWVNPIENPAEDWLKSDAPDNPDYHICTLRK